ncbi:MAG: hypothetical protein SRB2_02697 [Desulfobacteraceae bacterium Eth-SRB2]|nr:MAG: hypothetical protein SRB2_02697 [Desulfobacteraceae bacterium Eth-SRB2]
MRKKYCISTDIVGEETVCHMEPVQKKSAPIDRRRKVRDGITLKGFDRRQNNDPYYSGPERRSNMDRRSGME